MWSGNLAGAIRRFAARGLRGAPWFLLLLLAACSNQDMYEQPRYDPLEPSALFPDSQSARRLVPGTVARGYLQLDELALLEGARDTAAAESLRRQEEAFRLGEPSGGSLTGAGAYLLAFRLSRASDTFPLPVTPRLLERGQDRYRIYCTPCHGRFGDGEGIVTRHGFPAPPTFHQSRLLAAPTSHYFNVITNGFGRMYHYAYRVRPADRWAIIAYIRALQLSRRAPLEHVPAGMRGSLRERASTPMGGRPSAAPIIPGGAAPGAESGADAGAGEGTGSGAGGAAAPSENAAPAENGRTRSEGG